MKKTYLFGLMLVIIVIGSCKKDDNPSTKEMLTGKKWKLTASTVNPALSVGGTMITDWFQQMEDCEKDDIMNFKADGTYTAEEGVTKCDSSDPQVYSTGTWTLNSDETIIIVDPSDDSPVNNKIVSISSGTLKVSYEETYSSIKYTFTDTYTAQ